jgi:hypothetical protein
VTKLCLATAPPSGTVTPMTRASALITDVVRSEIAEALERNGAQLGLAYVAYQTGVTNPTDMFAAGVGANSGASGNLIEQVRSLLEGHIPPAPSRATQSLRAARSLPKQNRDRLSTETVAFLDALVAELDEAASDRRAIAEEDRELARTTGELDRLSATTGGVVRAVGRERLPQHQGPASAGAASGGKECSGGACSSDGVSRCCCRGSGRGSVRERA